MGIFDSIAGLFGLNSNTIIGTIISGGWSLESGEVSIKVRHGHDVYDFILAQDIAIQFWMEHRGGMTMKLTYQSGDPDVVTAYEILS